MGPEVQSVLTVSTGNDFFFMYKKVFKFQKVLKIAIEIA